MKASALFLLAHCALAAATFAQNPPVREYFAPIEVRPGLPRVPLIGDSISVGYTLPVRELLKDKANVHQTATLPDADPRPGRPRRGGRESKCSAYK